MFASISLFVQEHGKSKGQGWILLKRSGEVGNDLRKNGLNLVQTSVLARFLLHASLKAGWSFHASLPSRHAAAPLAQKASLLFQPSTKRISKLLLFVYTFLSIFCSLFKLFKHFFVLFGQQQSTSQSSGKLLISALLCKLKPRCLLPPSRSFAVTQGFLKYLEAA